MQWAVEWFTITRPATGMIMFIKIPSALFTASTKDIRLYCAFLDFKAFNPEGHICPPFKVNRHYYSYWRKKLVAKGWAFLNGRCISLVSYPQVWKDLGVLPGWSSKFRRYRFNYKKVLIEILPLDRKEYFKVLQEMVLKTITGNRMRQIKWRLKQKHKRDKRVNTSETFISTRTVARLVGLRSPASGHKYRNKLFQVIPEPTTIVKTDFGYRYKCKKIAL